jgi:hypothetical protein
MPSGMSIVISVGNGSTEITAADARQSYPPVPGICASVVVTVSPYPVRFAFPAGGFINALTS